MNLEDRRRAATAALFRSHEAAAQLEERTDQELATLLLEHVWAEMPITSAQSALVEQAIERLRRAGGGPFKREG